MKRVIPAKGAVSTRHRLMLYCNQCGHQNPDDSKFCNKCGSPIMLGQKTEAAQTAGPTQQVPPAPPPEDFGERFGRRMAAAGDRFGREMARAGDRLGWKLGGVGRRLEARRRKKFDLFGPLIGALICWGILVMIILGIQGAKTDAGETMYPDLGHYLGINVFLFFGLLILFGYVNEAHKRYRKQAIWVLPITVAAGLTIFSWLLAQVLSALAIDTGRQDIADAANAGQASLLVIFIVIVVVGYIMVFAGSRAMSKEVPLQSGYGK